MSMHSTCSARSAPFYRIPMADLTSPIQWTPVHPTGVTAKPETIPATLAVLCIVLVALTLRPAIVSVGPLLPDMLQTFGLSHTQASLLTAIPTLLMGLLAIPAPWLARRLGRDRVILAALAVLCASTVLRPFVGSIALLFLSTAGVGAGIAVAGALITGFIKASYPRQAALLVGVYATALALGSTLAAALTGPLASFAASWRISAAFWALPVIVALVAWLYVERRGRVGEQTKVPSAAHPMPLRNRTAWLIAVFFACNNFIFYAYISWIAPIYVDLGRTNTAAGLILASFTLAFMIANPLFGFLSRNEDRRLALAVSSAIAFTGILATALAPQAMPFVMVSVIAFGTGGAFTLGMTLPLDNTRTSEEANAWNAMVLLFSYIVAAAGPLVMGYLRDVTGNFQLSLWLLVAASFIMLALTPFLQPYRKEAASEPAPQGR